MHSHHGVDDGVSTERSRISEKKPVGVQDEREMDCEQLRPGHINLISQFPVLKYQGDLNMRTLRQKEYTEALASNLLHPFVKCVHVFLERREDEHFIRELVDQFYYTNEDALPPSLHNQGCGNVTSLWEKVQACGRIQLVPVKRWMLYSDAFGYARRYLPGELCAVLNSDISFSYNIDHLNAYQQLMESPSTNNSASPSARLFTSPEGRQKVFVLSRSQPKSKNCPSKGDG